MSHIPSVIGRYEVAERLAEGGMGTLYLARDPALDRLVVVKVLRTGLEDEQLRERFSREARSISRLRHPNIVTIFEYGDYQGQPFIAMEYVTGESWAEIIRRRAPLSLGRKLQMMEELCAGMTYAHRARIVHRDLKPANIMVDDDTGLIKILDFGIARSLEASLTSFSQIIGTPSYMSPEQAGGVKVDHRSDVFSIGAVFFELLSYTRAFDGDSHITILQRIQHEAPPLLAPLSPGITPAVLRIVDRALAKDRDARYQELEAMRVDLISARERLSRTDAESTIIVAPQGREAPVTPSLEKRRTAQVKQSLDTAQAAIEAQDYPAAVEACEQVLLLDHANQTALDLLERARTALDSLAIAGYIERARRCLAEQEFTKADQAVAEALKVRSNDPTALALQREIAQRRRTREIALERAAAAEAALSRARASLEQGAFELAVRTASEALAFSPDLVEARQIKDRASTAIEERRKERELERKASEVIQLAEQRFKNGEYDRAVEELERFTPQLPIVAATLKSVRERIATIVHERELEEERQRQIEAERQRQLEQAHQRQLEEERLRKLEEERLQKLEVERQRQLEADRQRKLEQERQLQLENERRAEEERRETERRAQLEKIAALSAEVRRLTENEDFAAAEAVVHRLSEGPGGREAANALHQEVDVARARADDRARAHREQQAHATVDQARRLFNAGAHEQAIRLLETFDVRHPLVDEALQDLRQKGAALVQGELEAKERAQHAAVSRQQQIALPPTVVVTPPASDRPASRSRRRAIGPARGKRNRWMSLVGSAAVLLVLPIAVFYWSRMPTSTPVSQAARSVTPPAPAPLPSTPATPPIESQSPPLVTTPPDTTASASPTPLAPPPAAVDPLQTLRQRLREQIRAGNQQQILDTLARGLAVARDDVEFSRELNTQYQKAETTARTAQAGADQVNARRLASTEYEQGLRSFQEATRMAPGRRADAARGYFTAAAAFDRARSVAQLEATQNQAPVAPPAPTALPIPPPMATPVQPEPQPPVSNPTAPPAANPAPPAPSADPVRAEREAIDRLLNEYEAAWSALDANAVRRIHPQAPADLNRTFDAYRSLTLQLQNRQITIAGNSASVICERLTNQVLKRANTKLQASNRIVMRLRKNGASWTVESVVQQ